MFRMLSRYKHEGLTWVDLESPSRTEVRDIMTEFDITPLVAEELLLPSTKPRMETYPGHMSLVLHFPALRHSHKTREQEIDFIIGRDFLITTRYDTIDPLHNFSKIFEVNSVLSKNNLGDHAGFLFFYMLKKLYNAVEHEVEYIQHDLAVIEGHIFSGQEAEMVSAVSRPARTLLNLRQAIEPHREVLREFETSGPRFFGDNFAPYARALSNEYYRAHNHIVRHTDFLHELRETNTALLSTKQNDTMQRLTVITAIMAPLSILTGIFGINARYIPIVDLPAGFWILLALMGAMVAVTILIFKLERWL